MVDRGVQKTFSDVFGCYGLQNRLWPEKPVGATKLIGACDKQQRGSDFTVKQFHDLLDANCTTNTTNSMEAFYYVQSVCKTHLPDHLGGHIHNAPVESVAAGFCRQHQRSSQVCLCVCGVNQSSSFINKGQLLI